MFSFQKSVCFRPSRHHLIAKLLLALLVAAHVPIPLTPLRSPNDKDRSRPFPCQDRPCGCRSAEQCKKQCCCFSNDQKLSWAKRNGVTSSEVVSSKDTCDTVSKSPRKECCLAKTAKAERNARQSSGTASIAKSRSKFVIGIVAQRCQGVDQTFSGQSVFLLPPQISLTLNAFPTGERIVPGKIRIITAFSDPPVPPPRLLSA